MSTEFSGRAAIITGASSGLGRATALRLGKAGMECWLVGRSSSELEKTADGIRVAGGPGSHCVALDIAREGALAELVDEVGQQHPWLFALVNNAAVMYPEPIVEADPARTRELFSIDLLSMMESCQAAVRQMRKHGRPGHIVNISSLASRSDLYGAYGIVKIAVNHLGRTLRRELEGDDIRVTTVIPGGFATNLARGFSASALELAAGVMQKKGYDLQGPDARRLMGEPDDVARMIEYILQQPIDLNLEEVVIRPAVSIDMA